MTNIEDLGVWKGEEVYNDTKKVLSIFNDIWKPLAGKAKIGSCSYLYKKLNPISPEDFFYKYVQDGKENRKEGLYVSGRSIEELYSLAKEYKKKSERAFRGLEYPLETYFDNIICHVICETYYGQGMERDVIDALVDGNFLVTHGSDDDDSKRNIDLMVYSNRKKLLCFIQVKPHSTFTGNNNQSLIDDRINFFSKQFIGNLKYPNIPYYYFIYHNGTKEWFFKTDEKGKKTYRFTLEELCDNETGQTKLDILSYQTAPTIEF